jgi:D-alanine-D-alanine ligase
MLKNIAVICGGFSGEAQISFMSVEMILSNIDKSKYTPFKIIISEKKWICEINGEEVDVDKNDFSLTLHSKKVKFDLAYIIIHGTPGEDGKLQGYFDMIHLPYTSGKIHNMSLTFNKKTTTTVLGNYGFNVAKSIVLKSKKDYNLSIIEKTFNLPFFIKPNNGGSSIGASKIENNSEIENAIDKAFENDSEVIIEDYLNGREFTCGVIWNGTKPMALHITEIESSKIFFDFDAKYKYDGTKEITPAILQDDLYKKCQLISEQIYSLLDCRGVIRIDYKLVKNDFFIIEVNTVPGMTEKSIVPQQAEAMGISKKTLIEMIIEDCLSGR